MRKYPLLGLAVIAIVLVGMWWVYRPEIGRAKRVATGLVSHEICSGVFVSGLQPEAIFAENLRPRPFFSLVAWALDYQVDRGHRAVTASFLGGDESRAVYRDELGCIVVQDAKPADTPRSAREETAERRSAALLPEIAGPEVVKPADDNLRIALDRAFAEPEHGPARRTKAVVVVRDGHVIAERYAPGYGPDTQLISYSVAKSVTNALLGILVREGRLSVRAPAPVAAWQGADDQRGRITIDQLARMTSGLAVDERNTGFDPWSRALYLARDIADFAESVPLEAAPGSTWNYTSGNTMILSRIIRDAVGGHAEDVLRFARHELFDPLGMRNVTVEFDAAGTPIGSTYVFATARDWARFGMLYVNDGIAGDKRILPEGWVAYSATRTLDSPYAAGFWLGSPQLRTRFGLPSDAFMAAGILGQRIVIIPSRRLVIARFGLWDEEYLQTEEDLVKMIGELIADVLAATDPPR
jgi:CubicO group peptidase (beta-lactamase class C family)